MSLRRLSPLFIVRGCGFMTVTTVMSIVAFMVVMVVMAFTSAAHAQVVYYGAMRPVIAAPVVAAPVYAAPVYAAPYIANYTPAGNYAAVTAFSPPVYSQPAAFAVTSNYAPAYSAGYAPTYNAGYPPAYSAGYAPVMAAAPVAVTSYYAPTAMTAYAPVTEVVAAPVTAYYAPAAVAVPLYRRGLFGGLRPVRSAYSIPY
ncbi:MAG: hypothetical protein WD060_02230 [Pirellulales bacterium]